MKKKLLLVARFMGFVFLYFIALVSSIFLTMNCLIKGEEVKAPSLVGLNLAEASAKALETGVYLKKIQGNYDKSYKPDTVIDQFPSPGLIVKRKSFVKVFVTSLLDEVTVPDLSGNSLKDCEDILREHNLKKHYVSYIDAQDVPVDYVIAQSVPAGSRVAERSDIDLLISKGRKSSSFIMPDLIGKSAEKVLFFFESRGLKISKITPVSYPGLQQGIVIKQYPSSGFRINSKNLISIQVSE